MPLDFAHRTYFLDLFSGIGGFSLGAYWAGLRFDAHYFSEVDPYAIRVYQQRFPDAIPLGDITKIDGRDLPSGEWIIAGGFPCQDISVAGKGAGLEGERSGLWYEYARIIGELRPRYAIMENVGALTFRGLDSVLGSLSEIGYDAEWQDIRASDVGAPHRRERIWIVGYPNSQRCKKQPNGLTTRARDADGEYGRASMADADGDFGYPSGESQTKRQSTNKPESGSKCNRAISWAAEPAVGRVANGVPSRVDRLKCLGNSIVPQIAEMIFLQSAFDEWRQDA